MKFAEGIVTILCLGLSLATWGKLPTGSYYSNLNENIASGLSVKESLYRTIEGHKVLSYRSARRHLFGSLHLERTLSGKYFVKDVYCEIERGSSAGVGPDRIPNHNKINTEHTWPQSRFNDNMSESAQLTDLHHLYPTDSRANSSRSNSRFGEVSGRDVHENCSASQRGSDVISGRSAFEPPPAHRGNVARALFYFSVRYKIAINDTEEAHLRKWHEDDPVDDAERIRNDDIYDIQGNRNPFIDEPLAVDDIDNF